MTHSAAGAVRRSGKPLAAASTAAMRGLGAHTEKKKKRKRLAPRGPCIDQPALYLASTLKMCEYSAWRPPLGDGLRENLRTRGCKYHPSISHPNIGNFFSACPHRGNFHLCGSLFGDLADEVVGAVLALQRDVVPRRDVRACGRRVHKEGRIGKGVSGKSLSKGGGDSTAAAPLDAADPARGLH